MKISDLGYKLLPMIGGGISGFFYWKDFGCTAGCAITGTWYGSVLLGGILGNLVVGMIVDFKNKEVK